MKTLQTKLPSARLGAEQTDLFLEPERIVRSFGLKSGDHVADFGAGHGFFTIPMARIVGGDGKVYAIDIQKSVLDIIRAKARLEHLLNIEPVWADLDEPQGSKLKDKFLDLVVIANILFQVEKKDNLFREAYRILREGGRLALVEWDLPAQLFNQDTAGAKTIGGTKAGEKSWEGETPAPMGPAMELRVKKDTAKGLALQAGLELEKEFEAGSHHYGLLFVKK